METLIFAPLFTPVSTAALPKELTAGFWADAIFTHTTQTKNSVVLPGCNVTVSSSTELSTVLTGKNFLISAVYTGIADVQLYDPQHLNQGAQVRI